MSSLFFQRRRQTDLLDRKSNKKEHKDFQRKPLCCVIVYLLSCCWLKLENWCEGMFLRAVSIAQCRQNPTTHFSPPSLLFSCHPLVVPQARLGSVITSWLQEQVEHWQQANVDVDDTEFVLVLRTTITNGNRDTNTFKSVWEQNIFSHLLLNDTNAYVPTQ